MKKTKAFMIPAMLVFLIIFSLFSCAEKKTMEKNSAKTANDTVQSFHWSGLRFMSSKENVNVGNVTYSVEDGKIIATFLAGNAFNLYDIEKDIDNKSVDDFQYNFEQGFEYILDKNYIYAYIARYIVRSEIGSNTFEKLFYIDEHLEKSVVSGTLCMIRNKDFYDNPYIFYLDYDKFNNMYRLHYYDIDADSGGFVAYTKGYNAYTDDTMFFTTYTITDNKVAPYIRFIKNNESWGMGVLGQPLNANGADTIAPVESEKYSDIRLTSWGLHIDENNPDIMYFHIDCFDVINGIDLKNKKVAYNVKNKDWNFVE